MRLVLLAALGIIIFLLISSSAPLKNKILDRLFPKPASKAELAPSVPDEILVKFKSGIDEKNKDHIRKAHGLEKLSEIEPIGVEKAKVPQQAKDQIIEALNQNRRVEYAEANFLAFQLIEPNDPYFDKFPPNIGAKAAWDISKGNLTMPVAVIDSGVNAQHEDLQFKILPGFNFKDNSDNTQDVTGHGTAVAGVVGAATNNNLGLASLGWETPIMPLLVVDKVCRCATYADIASAVIFAAEAGVKSINISLGGSAISTPLQDAINYAWNKGVVIAAAAGDSGGCCINFPASADHVIAVGASTAEDTKASFSNIGDRLDMMAPGQNIYSTSLSGGYDVYSGTSFSTPSVSALAALIFAINPQLTPQQVVEIIYSTAYDLGDPGWDQYFGHGRIQADQAVQKAAGINPPPADTQAPTTLIKSPTDGSTVSGLVDIAAEASDDRAVTKVELYIDGHLFATDTTSSYLFLWDTASSVNTLHSLQTKAYDNAGNIGLSSVVSVTIDNTIATPSPDPNMPDKTAPAVSITFPTDGSLVKRNSRVNIQAEATDNVKVAKVEFYVNSSLKCIILNSPYTCSWRVIGRKNITYTIKAAAIDSSNNVSAVSIQVKPQ